MPTSVRSGILIHPAVWPQQTWAEKLGAADFLFGREVGYTSNTMSPGPRPTSLLSGILIHRALWPMATTNMGQKVGVVPPLGRELGLHLTQCVAWAEAYLRTKWHLDPSSHFATTDMD